MVRPIQVPARYGPEGRSGASNPFEEYLAASPSRRARSVFLHDCWVSLPAEKACDPVRTFPLFFVAVARKPPAAQLEANHVGCGKSAAADAVVLACRSF